MTKFLTGLFYLLTSCAPVLAADRIVEGTSLPGISYEKNFVKNPEAEKNANNLTLSAAIATRTTTTPLQGAGSFSIDATASAQTVKFDTNTLDQYLKGQNCEAKFIFTGDATLYKAYVEQGANKVTTDLTLTNETNSKAVSINFPCGDLSSNSHMVIESTGNGAAIKVDKVYLGGTTNIGQTNLAVPTTSYTPTLTNFAATINSATYRVENDMMHLTGTMTLTGVPTGNLTVSLPAGYTINTSKIGSVVGSTNLNSVYAFDATGNVYTGSVVYNATGNITFGGPNTTARWNATIPFTWAASDTISYQASFPINEAYSVQTLMITQTPWFIEARLDGGNSSLGVVNVAAFTEITNASWTLTPATGSAPVGAVCATTNAATAPTTAASTCAAGNESAGISFVNPTPGTFEVCTQWSIFYEVDQSEQLVNNFQLVETPTNAQTILTSTNMYAHSGINGGATSGASNSTRPEISHCANFTWSSVGTRAIRLFYDQVVAGVPNNSLFLAATTTSRPRWSVKQLSVPYPMPILVNSVTSNTGGAERIERASITNGGSAAIASQSGSWISSVSRPGVGQVNVVFATGIFSAAPSCVVTMQSGGSGVCQVFTGTTSTQQNVFCRDSSFAATDFNFTLICMGQR